MAKKVVKKPVKARMSTTAASVRTVAGKYVDMLGDVQAELGPLRDRDAELKDVLKSFANGKNQAYDGKRYRASVSYSTPMVLDRAKVERFMKRMGLTDKQIASYKAPGEERCTIKVVSLNAAGKNVVK